MKNIFTLALLFSIKFSFSQNIPIDFEANGHGLNWTWTTFENDTNPPLEVVANPDPYGINTSATVAKFTALQSGAAWAGCESMHGSDIGSFSLNNSNCTVSIMVWKSIISDVGIKFVDAANAAQPEIKVANTLTNQWEEIVFDFSSRIGVFPITKDQIVIFPDFNLNGRTQDNIIYFDNVYGSNSSTATDALNTSHAVIYPNPSKETVFIELGNYQGNINVKVYDLMGILVASSTSRRINIQSFPTGVYLFEIKYQGKTEVKKVIKE